MGVLKTQNTLTIAVWASIIIHTAGFLGFELAFSNRKESFPKSEPRTVSIVSISTLSHIVSPVELVAENIPSQASIPLKNEFPVGELQETSSSEFAPENIIKNNHNESISAVDNSVKSNGSEGIKEIILVTEPLPVRSIEPEYPFRARKKGLEGNVVLVVLISKYGEPVSCYIADSSGHKDLDNAAKETVLSSYFQPGTINGEDIESTLRISISFQLNKS